MNEITAVPFAAGKNRNAKSSRRESQNAKQVRRQTLISGEKKVATPSISVPKSQNYSTNASKAQPVKDISYIDAQSAEERCSRKETLLEGFESSEEEDIRDSQAIGNEHSFKVTDIPTIPKPLPRSVSQAESDTENNTGIVYVGRIPHGFYEHQMKAYFSQFGEIRRLRLSRNRKTGRSKHYAFLEFASAEVADIVAATMDKYLLFGHILQVRVIPPKQVHSELFKGTDRRFRVIPRNLLEARLLRKGRDRRTWEKKIKMEEIRRRKKTTRVKNLMKYDYKPSNIRNTANLPMRKAEHEITDAVINLSTSEAATSPTAFDRVTRKKDKNADN